MLSPLCGGILLSHPCFIHPSRRRHDSAVFGAVVSALLSATGVVSAGTTAGSDGACRPASLRAAGRKEGGHASSPFAGGYRAVQRTCAAAAAAAAAAALAASSADDRPCGCVPIRAQASQHPSISSAEGDHARGRVASEDAAAPAADVLAAQRGSASKEAEQLHPRRGAWRLRPSC